MEEWEIANSVMHVRGMLDMVYDYLVGEQSERSAEEKLETVVHAVEMAQRDAREAEEALFNWQPFRQ